MPIYAAADIGSNTLHLLVANATASNITHLTSQNNWLSLGSIVSKKGYLPPSLLDEIVRTLDSFKKEAIKAGSKSIYIFATEAIRLASNHRELVNRIYRELKLNISIIDPIKETEFSWKGSLIDSKKDFSTLFIEVGGGSIQIALAENEKLCSISSLPLGTGRLITLFDLTQPITKKQTDDLKQYVQEYLRDYKVLKLVKNVVVSGGVSRALVRAIHPDKSPYINLEELDYLTWSTSKLSIKQISKKFNIKSKRAPSLVPGSIIFSIILRHFNQTQMFVSDYGAREGAILSLFEGKISACPI